MTRIGRTKADYLRRYHPSEYVYPDGHKLLTYGVPLRPDERYDKESRRAEMIDGLDNVVLTTVASSGIGEAA